MTELTGIGAELRRARESQGLSVDDVAQQLKFAPRQIESLEQERFERLPGPTIARGMVRNYARLLGLDAEPLIERLSPKMAPPPDAAQLGARFGQAVPFSDSSRRSTLIYAGFSVAVLALAGLVAYQWQGETAPAQPVPAATEPVPAVAEPVAAAESVAPVRAPAPEVAPAPPAQPAAPIPPPVQEKKAVAATGGFHQIVLVCEQESWLEVKDGTGRVLVSSLAPAGSERAVRGRGPFEIVIGNAHGVRLVVDDKPVDLKRHTRGDVARVTIP